MGSGSRRVPLHVPETSRHTSMPRRPRHTWPGIVRALRKPGRRPLGPAARGDLEWSRGGGPRQQQHDQDTLRHAVDLQRLRDCAAGPRSRWARRWHPADLPWPVPEDGLARLQHGHAARGSSPSGLRNRPAAPPLEKARRGRRGHAARPVFSLFYDLWRTPIPDGRCHRVRGGERHGARGRQAVPNRTEQHARR
jgi:hypothetical protein